jgi:hypothetical protein
MSGFVVEIVRSLDGRVPSAWLSDSDQGLGIVADRAIARVFPTDHEAQVAADQYCGIHRGRVATYVIRRK